MKAKIKKALKNVLFELFVLIIVFCIIVSFTDAILGKNEISTYLLEYYATTILLFYIFDKVINVIKYLVSTYQIVYSKKHHYLRMRKRN